MRLCQQGRIALDCPLAAYLPNLPESWNAVTVRHCLAHQSGIPAYTDVEAYWRLTRAEKSHEQILDLVRDLPPRFPPGERHAYDNSGFYLLGMVIEAVTQQSYADYLRAAIFEPLHMTQTRVNDYRQLVAQRAQGYDFEGDRQHNRAYYDTSNTFSAGILLSTVRDLLAWSAALHNDAVLSAESRLLWWTPQPSRVDNERENGYALTLGWFIVDDPLAQFYGHNGSIPGFASAFLHFPSTKLTTVLLCNAGHVRAPHKIALDILRDQGLI